MFPGPDSSMKEWDDNFGIPRDTSLYYYPHWVSPNLPSVTVVHGPHSPMPAVREKVVIDSDRSDTTSDPSPNEKVGEPHKPGSFGRVLFRVSSKDLRSSPSKGSNKKGGET